MSRCRECGAKIIYESSNEEGFWCCQDCGEPTSEEDD